MRGANDRDLGSGLAMSPVIMSRVRLVARRSHVHMLDGCACRLGPLWLPRASWTARRDQ